MTPPSPDWEAEGLLDALSGDARAARVRLLDALDAGGTTVAELRTAVREGRLAALPAEHLLGGPLRYSARDAAEINRLPLEMVLAVRRANGLPIADPEAIELSQGDLETGETAEIDTGSARVRAWLATRLRERADLVGALLKRSGIDAFEVVLPDPAEAAADPKRDAVLASFGRKLLELFARRERRR